MTSVVLATAILTVTRSPFFRVREVRVEGLTHGPPARIVRLAGLSEHDRTLWLDVGAVRERVERDPWVAQARIDIDLPSSVTIRITERSPVGAVDLGFGALLVDAEGVVIGPATTGRFAEIVLPPSRIGRVAGAGGVAGVASLRGAARVLAALPPEIHGKVVRVEAEIGSGLELVLRDGVRIRYGSPREPGAKAEAVTEVFRWVRDAGERVRAINVMAPSAPSVVLAG
jgi:cell division protein FtsQ